MKQEEVIHFYRQQCEQWKETIAGLNRKIYRVGTARLLLVVGAGGMLYGFRDESWLVLAVIAVAFILPFAWLMVLHNRYFAWRGYAEARLRLNQHELKALEYDFSAFDGGEEYADASHSFTFDLDIFGHKSLFQSMNRTVTREGKALLADWLKHPLDCKEQILVRQEAVRELAGQPELFQHFYAVGTCGEVSQKPAFQASTLDAVEVYFSRKALWKALVWLVPAGWLVLLAANMAGWCGSSWLGLYLVAAMLIGYWHSGRIARIHQAVDKLEQVLVTYSSLMDLVEKEKFSSSLLAGLHRNFRHGERKASDSLQTLSRHIGALNQRFSLAGAIFNLFFMRDIRQAMALERWKERHIADVPRWIESLAMFDACFSFGNYAFSHPDYVFPEIADSYFRMEGRDVGHPLLHRDVCVRNDIQIPASPWFLIITGANMAGKSTYLRTVGVNYVLACAGLPVCATSLTVYPAHLVTSLRTSDSLASNESYFFAELKRLKMIIDRLQQGERLFIILDEILKGTNSADKQKGSMALMKQLVALESCGIIATHDLVLGTLEAEFAGKIKNYRFEADIHQEELSFSYRLREGVAQNMNACFLMKKMGITV